MKSCIAALFILAIFAKLKIWANSSTIGTFYHITDLHIDPNYDLKNGNPEQMCWTTTSGEPSSSKPGRFGDRKCDAPATLINSVLNAMKRIDPSPDFIIWTGDDTAHISEELFTTDKIYNDIAILTDMINKSFPNTLVFPVLGNHDYYPKGQVPPGRNELQTRLAKLWSSWLDGINAYESFEKVAQYYGDIPNTNVSIIGLNTILWYRYNRITSNDPSTEDPAGLFQMMEQDLQRIKDSNRMAYIIGHVAPGVSEKFGSPDLQMRYNEKYIQVIERHAPVIAGQFFGHQHTDMFRVLLSKNTQEPISTLFLAPSVSPFRFSFSLNPSFRRIMFDRSTGEIKEISSFYMDLDRANANGNDEWVLLYNMTSFYGIDKIDPTNLFNVASNLKNDRTFFNKFYSANTVQGETNSDLCDQQCHLQFYCSITQVDIEDFHHCLNPAPSGASSIHSFF